MTGNGVLHVLSHESAVLVVVDLDGGRKVMLLPRDIVACEAISSRRRG